LACRTGGASLTTNWRDDLKSPEDLSKARDTLMAAFPAGFIGFLPFRAPARLRESHPQRARSRVLVRTVEDERRFRCLFARFAHDFGLRHPWGAFCTGFSAD
jgi:hypothetical protein